MRDVAESLRKTLAETVPLLQNIADESASVRLSPDKWTNKEIIGHLIDSACNNQQKFVRAMMQEHAEFAGYRQNFWVDLQKYNEAGWKDLLNLWQAYNLHLAHIIENTGRGLLSHTISIEGSGSLTLEFMMKDYVEHLRHHLKQILPAANLENKF